MNKLKYVPVLRFREQERKALAGTSISDKMLPLVEIMQDTSGDKRPKDMINEFVNDFHNFNTYVMLDFPLYLPIQSNTQEKVRDFIQRLKAAPATRIQLFLDQRLTSMNNLIPVITYDPSTPYIQGDLVNQELQLRPYYEIVAYRIFPNHFQSALSDIANCIKDGDLVLFDIDEEHHHNTVLNNLYPLIKTMLPNVTYKTVLIRSAIPRDLYNTQLTTGQVITQADNGLLRSYNKLGFDAFGDFVGIKRDFLTDIPRISPGFIYYSWSQNVYYGFSGTRNNLSSFITHITPAVLNSIPWQQYNAVHKCNCIGCLSINNISQGTERGKSQAKWKGFAFAHYLYTMEEFL